MSTVGRRRRTAVGRCLSRAARPAKKFFELRPYFYVSTGVQNRRTSRRCHGRTTAVSSASTRVQVRPYTAVPSPKKAARRAWRLLLPPNSSASADSVAPRLRRRAVKKEEEGKEFTLFTPCLLKSCRGAPRRADWEAWSKAECVFRASPCLARTFRANNLGNLVAAIAADPMGDAAMHRTLDRTPSCLRASLV